MLQCWHQPQFNPVRHSHVKQWHQLVVSDSTTQRRRPDGHLMHDGCGLHRRGQQRQHGGRVNDHGNHERRTSVDRPESTSGNQSIERGLMSEHRRLLRSGSQLSPFLRQCWIRMGSPRDPDSGQRTEWDFVCDKLRLHSSRIRHLRKPSSCRNDGWRWHLDGGDDSGWGRRLDWGFMCQCIRLRRSKRLQFAHGFTCDHRHHRRWVCVVVGDIPRHRQQLHGHFLRGLRALHGCRFVFGRPRSSDPQHHKRRQHLDTASCSIRDHPQRHLLLVRDNVPGNRIPRDWNLKRRIEME